MHFQIDMSIEHVSCSVSEKSRTGPGGQGPPSKHGSLKARQAPNRGKSQPGPPIEAKFQKDKNIVLGLTEEPGLPPNSPDKFENPTGLLEPGQVLASGQ